MARAVRVARRRSVKQWTGTQNGTPVVLTTTQATVLSFTSDEATTLIRSRGSIIVNAIPNAAADNDWAIFGLIIATDEAIAAGGASLPSPVGSADGNWLWHQYVGLMDGVSTAANAASIGLNHVVTIDSKAMRKVGRNQNVVLVGELATGEMASVQVIAGLRVLELLA